MSELPEEKRPRGRPKIYKPELSEKLLELMAQGKKDCQIFAEFGISKQSFYGWIREYPEFKDAYERGLELCEKWWEEHGLKQMMAESDAGFKYWIAFMNRKFGWRANGPSEGTQININTMNVIQNQSKDELIAYIEDQLKELPIDAEFIPIELKDSADSLTHEVSVDIEQPLPNE